MGVDKRGAAARPPLHTLKARGGPTCALGATKKKEKKENEKNGPGGSDAHWRRAADDARSHPLRLRCHSVCLDPGIVTVTVNAASAISEAACSVLIATGPAPRRARDALCGCLQTPRQKKKKA